MKGQQIASDVNYYCCILLPGRDACGIFCLNTCQSNLCRLGCHDSGGAPYDAPPQATKCLGSALGDSKGKDWIQWVVAHVSPIHCCSGHHSFVTQLWDGSTSLLLPWYLPSWAKRTKEYFLHPVRMMHCRSSYDRTTYAKNCLCMWLQIAAASGATFTTPKTEMGVMKAAPVKGWSSVHLSGEREDRIQPIVTDPISPSKVNSTWREQY